MQFPNRRSCHNNGYHRYNCFLQTGTETIICPLGRFVTSVYSLKLFIIVSLCNVRDLPNTKDFFSAEIFKDKGHLCKIIALQPFVGTEVESSIYERIELSPTQVKLTEMIYSSYFRNIYPRLSCTHTKFNWNM